MCTALFTVELVQDAAWVNRRTAAIHPDAMNDACIHRIHLMRRIRVRGARLHRSFRKLLGGQETSCVLHPLFYFSSSLLASVSN